MRKYLVAPEEAFQLKVTDPPDTLVPSAGEDSVGAATELLVDTTVTVMVMSSESVRLPSLTSK
jgi:hypothetical protein